MLLHTRLTSKRNLTLILLLGFSLERHWGLAGSWLDGLGKMLVTITWYFLMWEEEMAIMVNIQCNLITIWQCGIDIFFVQVENPFRCDELAHR